MQFDIRKRDGGLPPLIVHVGASVGRATSLRRLLRKRRVQEGVRRMFALPPPKVITVPALYDHSYYDADYPEGLVRPAYQREVWLHPTKGWRSRAMGA